MSRDDHIISFLQAYSRFIRRLWEAGRELKKQYDISGPQMGILRIIEYLGPCSLGDIQTLTAGHLSALGQKVDRLEAAGWLERHRDPQDRRKLELTLTSRARRMLKKEPMVGPARVMEVMATLPARESRRVAEAMELVSRMMVGEEDHD